MLKNFSKNTYNKVDHTLVLDVGTTGIKAFVFNAEFKIEARVNRPVKKRRLKKDWVEQDPLEILSAAKQVLKEAVRASRVKLNHFSGFGLTNQRETVIAWDRITGQPIYPAIVWEDKRTLKGVKALKGTKGFCEGLISEKTGLRLDPYFSATKIQWILENVPKARQLLAAERLLVGTVDTWFLWNLCEDEPFLTDETNASRTLLFNLKKKDWDEELLELFGVPREILPDVFSSGAKFGFLKKEIIGAKLPVLAVAGDQQASAYAAGTKVGATKVTYGTGAFVDQSLGNKFKLHADFFTTLLPTVGGKPIFCFEAKVENCAAAVEPVLKDPKKLRQVLTGIAKKVDILIKKLPNKPKLIIVDGGVTRDGIIIEEQQKISGVPIRSQIVFDGTALGVAKLIVDVLKKK
ncbi:MAG: FGGY family carbohydrate kinase [Patescibacteria group bacterium]|jgi:glycerol kinase